MEGNQGRNSNMAGTWRQELAEEMKMFPKVIKKSVTAFGVFRSVLLLVLHAVSNANLSQGHTG